MPLPLVVVWLIEEARQTRSLPELVQFKIWHQFPVLCLSLLICFGGFI
jgi:hypothetical protein